MVDFDSKAVDGMEDSEIERNFIADCNEVIHFKLVRKASDIDSEECEFFPEMSHQIFGKMERIFGYKDLRIDLYYTAGQLCTYLNITYKEKIDSDVVQLPADDVIGTLSRFLSHDYLENKDLFVQTLSQEPSFKPSGDLVHRFQNSLGGETNEITFEIYHVNVSNTGSNFFEKYYQRFQRFLIWYIDGASYVETDDDKWNYFLLYEKYKNENDEECYGIAGVTTVYEYYAFPHNIRPRISQVLVLPPFQQCGLAVQLLETVYRFYCNNKTVVDITVEDPTDYCQIIRDYVDLRRCEKFNIFSDENIKGGFTKEMENKLKTDLKIHKKQGRRLYEIMLLKTINKSDEEQYKKYRIFVKNRLNAPFLKMNLNMRRRICRTLKPEEVECAEVFQKPEIRLNTLSKMYNELEEQYEHVLKRYLKESK